MGHTTDHPHAVEMGLIDKILVLGKTSTIYDLALQDLTREVQNRETGAMRIPVKTATCSGNNFATFQSSNSLVDSNTKVAGLDRNLHLQEGTRESPED
ncbi:MAG: hypothetical protein U9N38_05220 [Thermodesulfobacteriota bacterium]|nr:hypothetical protein [Thermodesulfobacteriota bacterium]